MTGSIVEIKGHSKKAKVIFVYTEAIASGTSEYVGFTMLAVQFKDQTVKHVYPRDVVKVWSPFEKDFQ